MHSYLLLLRFAPLYVVASTYYVLTCSKPYPSEKYIFMNERIQFESLSLILTVKDL